MKELTAGITISLASHGTWLIAMVKGYNFWNGKVILSFLPKRNLGEIYLSGGDDASAICSGPIQAHGAPICSLDYWSMGKFRVHS